MNPLSVQGYQNAYHNHEMDHTHGMDHVHYTSGTTGEDSPDHTHSIDHNHSASGSCAIGGNSSGEGVIPCGSDYFTDYSVSVSVNWHYGSSGGASARHTHSWGAWSGAAYKDDHVSSRGITDGASRTTTSYNGDVNAQESRPTNVTVRIWIRTR